MEGFFTRYRNTIVLAVVVLAQVVLLGYQVRREDDVRLLRVWAVSAVTPFEMGLNATFDFFRSNIRDYLWLSGARQENERLRIQLAEQKLENQQLHRLLERFGREEEVRAFQNRFSSQTLMAEIIGVGSNPNAKEVFIDKGAGAGIKSGMGVITPDGIVGKVQAVYASSSLVLLISDPGAGAGVVLENSRVRGVLKGSGTRRCRLQYVGNEVEVRIGEKIFTSGDDRIFPRGLPAGEVIGIGVGSAFQEIHVKPFAALDRLDEVLVITAGVHQDLPAASAAQAPRYLMPLAPVAPPSDALSADAPAITKPGGDALAPAAPAPAKSTAKTDADRLLERYRRIGAYQNHTFGEGGPGSPPPNFNLSEPRADSETAGQGTNLEAYRPRSPVVGTEQAGPSIGP